MRTQTRTTVQLWDIAGVNGLQAMKEFVGEPIDRIAPFQSLETQIADVNCSVLRLCEGNFRIACYQENSSLAQAFTDLPFDRFWIKQFDWLGSLILPESTLAPLRSIAIAKPPYRLENLLLHCAVPARIDGISVVIWRHPIAEQSAIELHTARQDLVQLRAIFHRFL